MAVLNGDISCHNTLPIPPGTNTFDINGMNIAYSVFRWQLTIWVLGYRIIINTVCHNTKICICI